MGYGLWAMSGKLLAQPRAKTGASPVGAGYIPPLLIEVLWVSQGGGIYAAPTDRRRCCRRGRGCERSWVLQEAQLITALKRAW